MDSLYRYKSYKGVMYKILSFYKQFLWQCVSVSFLSVTFLDKCTQQIRRLSHKILTNYKCQIVEACDCIYFVYVLYLGIKVQQHLYSAD